MGPELITQKQGKVKLSLTTLLANHLSQKIPNKESRHGLDNLAFVAHQIQNKYGGSLALQLETSSLLKELAKKVDIANLRKLSQIPFYMIISSTPDGLLETVFKENGKSFYRDFYHFRGNKKNDLAWDQKSHQTLIYQIYGSVDKPNSMVLSPDELLDFFVAVISKKPGLPPKLLNELRKTDTCLLFLGFGFDQWYLRMLLHIIIKSQRQSHSFAMEQFDNFVAADFKETIIFFEEKHNIYLYQEDIDGFVDQLLEKYNEGGENGGPAPGPGDQPDDGPSVGKPTDTSPMVFICYSKEDSKNAQWVNDKLKSAGFETWIDVDMLGGTEWDPGTQAAISEEVDYFVVLQSKAMLKKKQGYCYKEIRIALERQKEFRPGDIFIIPTRIDDCNMIKSLKPYDCIDLHGEGGIEQLINTIKNDYYHSKEN